VSNTRVRARYRTTRPIGSQAPPRKPRPRLEGLVNSASLEFDKAMVVAKLKGARDRKRVLTG
jgi:hypothetical protein